MGDGTVLKIPYNNVGIKSNELEYEYYKQKSDIVAKIYKYENNLIIQEKLDNVVVVPYAHTINGTAKEYLLEKGINVDEKLLKEMLNTKVQIGRDRDGKLKFFDYEDAKIKYAYNEKIFKINEGMIDDFCEYIKKYGIDEIQETKTFEDHKEGL